MNLLPPVSERFLTGAPCQAAVRLTPPSLPVPHREFLARCEAALGADARFVGLAAGGSYLTDTMDGFSDLDLVLAVEPSAYDDVLASRTALAGTLGTLLAAFTGEHVGEPRLLKSSHRRESTLKRLCVFAGSSSGTKPVYGVTAVDLGRLLVARGIELVYGGGKVGLMGILADTVLAGGGHVIGVIPGALMAREVGHAGVPDLRVVGSMHERKALMADLADGFIALPGGWGTLDELFEILTWGQLGLHGKPVGLLNAGGYFDPLLAFLAHSVDEGFVRQENHAMIVVSDAPADLLGKLVAYTPPAVEKWIGTSAGETR